MTSLVFPDVNVWLALSTRDHRHFDAAWNWYSGLPDNFTPIFCRFTQLGFLRLLTTRSVMGPGTLTQAEAWRAYDDWIRGAGVSLAAEPAGLDEPFRSMSSADQASPKEWADGYLAAFSRAAEAPLVTFDRALAAKAEGSILLA